MTRRQQLQEVVRDAEARYRSLVEQLPAITYIAALDDVSTTLYISPQVEQLLGFTPDEWLADPDNWVNRLHAADREAVLAEFERCRRVGAPFATEYRLLARDGRVVWFHDRAAMVQPVGSEPGFLQGVMLDITERKVAEAALRAAEAKYRNIVEDAIEGIFQSTPDGHVLTANPALARLLGYTSPQELIDSISDAKTQIYAHPQDRETLADRLLHDGFVEGFECQVRRKNGSSIWILQNTRLVRDDNGDPLYFEGTVADISARKRAESEHARLEHERDQFFSSISHDLRTPLAAITASVGVILANEPRGTSPALHRLLVNIDESADDMARLVEDLLELTRLQARRIELYREQTDLRDIVLRAVREVEPLAQARGQRIEVQIPSAPLLGWVDSERLRRVLVNLIGNANKFGRDQGCIRVQLDEHPREAVFSVVDDGPGISAPDQPRIFERFYRVDSVAAATKGSGLGLPIARALVELHGGRISVESEPGRGATFRVLLPLGTVARGSEDIS